MQASDMPREQFVCPTPKCGYAIASEGMNAIQLKALRVWKKTCPKCGKISRWVEQSSLLNTQTIKTNGISQNEETLKPIKKSTSQRRAANRHSGLH